MQNKRLRSRAPVHLTEGRLLSRLPPEAATVEINVAVLMPHKAVLMSLYGNNRSSKTLL